MLNQEEKKRICDEYRVICQEQYPYYLEAQAWIRAQEYLKSLKPTVGDVSSEEARDYVSHYEGFLMILQLIKQVAMTPERMKAFYESPPDLYAVNWKKLQSDLFKKLGSIK